MGRRARGLGAAAALLVAVAAGAACEPAPPVIVEAPLPELVGGEPGPGSTLVGCDRAAEVVTVTGPTHLDPSCTYTGGFRVAASHATLDCRGARIEDPTGEASRGILVTTPADVPLTDVTVRNCVVVGFLNNVRVTREGFRSLPAGDESEYENGTAGIVLENSHLYSARGSGVFVDGFVTGVTLRDLEVAGAGSVGIYLEAGSKGNVVRDNRVHRNGFEDVYGEGVPFEVGGTRLRYHSTGREGLAIDGSRDNVVTGNVFGMNANGGVMLYKNCGEFATERPEQWWTRPYGATGNLIEGNTFVVERHGVWVGSRMAENQVFMDCSDDAYVDEPLTVFHRDVADHNTVRGNEFLLVPYGVRVEDDATRVEGNTFTIGDPAHRSVVVGTRERTVRLGLPVTGTTVTGNATTAPDGTDAYVWIHGHEATTFAGNTTNGAEAPLGAGTQPPQDPFLMVRDFWVE